MSIEWSKTPCCHSSCFVLNPGQLTVLTPKRKCRHAKEVINYYSCKCGKRPDWKKDCIILVTVSIPWAWPPSLNEFNQTDNELTKANPVILSELHIMPIITVRKRSCGKVMFLHLSVSHSVHGGVGGVCLSACWDTPPWVDTPVGQTPPLGGVCLSACWDTPPWLDTPAGQTPPPRWADTPPPPRWADTPPGQTPGYCSEWYTSYWNVYCSERYASYWNAFLLLPTNEVAGR